MTLGMRHASSNVANHQQFLREKLLTNLSFENKTQLDFVPIKELEEFTIKDEEIAHHVQETLDEYNFARGFKRSHELLLLMRVFTRTNINNFMFNYKLIHNA